MVCWKDGDGLDEWMNEWFGCRTCTELNILKCWESIRMQLRTSGVHIVMMVKMDNIQRKPHI